MALSGSFQTSKASETAGSQYPCFVYCNWSAKQNISNNSSTVTFSLYGGSDGSNTNNYTHMYEISLYVNGTRVYYDKNTATTIRKGQLLANGTQSIAIPHNSDGTKTVSIELKAAISSTSFNCSYSGNIVLDQIFKATQPSTKYTSVFLGDSLVISLPRMADSLTHNLYFSFTNGKASGTIATGAGASYTWVPPKSLGEYIINSAQVTCQIICETYHGNTHIGTRTCNVELDIAFTPVSFSPNSLTLGETKETISTSGRCSSHIVHNITYKFGSASGTIATGIGEEGASWIPPLSLATQIPNSISGTGTIRVDVYNGIYEDVARVVTFEHPITFSVSSSVVPSISGIATEDPKGYLSKYGGYVQSKSTVKITVSASGAYGSTIKSYEISANSSKYTSNGATTGALQNSGTNVVSAKVTDSRGRTASKSINISVLAYSVPSIITLTAVRCLSDGTADESGSYMKVTVGASIVSLNSKNSKKFVLYYKKASDSSWTTHATYTDGYSLSTSYIIPADGNHSYNIMLQAIDDFSNSSKQINIGTAFTLMDFRSTGKGIALGKVSEEDNLDVNLKTRFRQDLRSEADVIAGLGTSNQVSLQTLNSNLSNVSSAVSSIIPVYELRFDTNTQVDVRLRNDKGAIIIGLMRNDNHYVYTVVFYRFTSILGVLNYGSVRLVGGTDLYTYQGSDGNYYFRLINSVNYSYGFLIY